eukprot:TRINITY_DN33878_c0_g1_i1.p1 TRINITY_DN33878_c0_g1~~TRINITY_DN33878_c0_g1_i1.p1  ORF type:complete len:150 (+),score=30.58 TRINITY_DN33878_c0_g1_i1:22-450(+)
MARAECDAAAGRLAVRGRILAEKIDHHTSLKILRDSSTRDLAATRTKLQKLQSALTTKQTRLHLATQAARSTAVTREEAETSFARLQLQTCHSIAYEKRLKELRNTPGESLTPSSHKRSHGGTHRLPHTPRTASKPSTPVAP